jgi:Holliday junction DNA helicase RuvA
VIAFLEGTLISGGTEAVVSVGGGLGLDVQLSAFSADRLPAPGQPIRLWTHLAVREDNWSLYGFCDLEERTMFRLLITVSGVGPKVALGMLSKAAPADIALYLRTGDEKALTTLPGIGKKGAARLIVELGKRVPDSALSTDMGLVSGGPPPGGLGEAIAVLQAMGVAPAAAERALLKARQIDPEIDPAVKAHFEKWVRLALQNL